MFDSVPADEYKQDRGAQAEKDLDRALAEFGQAATTAMTTRSKEKQVEIRMRESIRRLTEIARSVPFDESFPVLPVGWRSPSLVEMRSASSIPEAPDH